MVDYNNYATLQKLKNANESLGISDDFSIEKNKNIIFIYTPPKVGSTTLVSSIRINACSKFTVLHLHNEVMLRVLYKIKDITVLDIIKYNKFLGKNVYVIDIYRTPIEQKISTFFENISSFHFNVPVDILNTFDINRIITRFNQVFPYLQTSDHFKTKYQIPFPDDFDFEKKYTMVIQDNIKYFKIRLKDSNEWRSILKNILGMEIFIVTDYETNKKPISGLFSQFKNSYRLPQNLFETIENDENLKYYYNETERQTYLNSWRDKINPNLFKTFTTEEYAFYTDIALDNQYISEIQHEHYIDNYGCLCNGCSRKRGLILMKVMKGEPISEKINHTEAVGEYLKQKAKSLPIVLMNKKKKQFGVMGSMY